MLKTLSVAMIAMNEEANLPRTLESVKWADEIVVVDSGSRDRTIEIAQSFGGASHHTNELAPRAPARRRGIHERALRLACPQFALAQRHTGIRVFAAFASELRVCMLEPGP